MSNEEILKRIAKLVEEGEEGAAVDAVKEAFAAGIDPMDVLNKGASVGLTEVGNKYSSGEAYLPELVLAGDAMSAILDIILDNMDAAESAANKRGKVVFGQATGDVHDIGKNIVEALLAVNGFEVVDLGIDVPPKTFYERAVEENADIVAISTLLTTSIPFQKDTLQYFTDTDTRGKFFYIVGGGPVTAEYAKSIGADGWGQTAFDCVLLCKKLIEMSNPGENDTILIENGKEVAI